MTISSTPVGVGVSITIIALGSYLVGAVPFGFLIGKMKGIDIRKHGSGNIGATNVTRVVGKGWGRLCFFLDFLKGAFPVIAASMLSTRESSQFVVEHLPEWLKMEPCLPDPAGLLACVAAFAAVCGHIWPVYLKFKGGKGISTAAGAILALNPLSLISAGVVWAVVFFASRYVSLASIAAAVSIAVFCVVFRLAGLSNATRPEILLLFLLAALAVTKHASNIKRLREGTENKFERKKKAAPLSLATLQDSSAIHAAVLGDGAWGTALALTLHANGHKVKVWGAFQENIDAVNRDHENKKFLAGVPIPDDLEFTSDMESAVKDARLVVLATPSQYLRGVLQKFKPYLNPDTQIVVDIVKGIEVSSLLTMSELCRQELGPTHYVALSGPSHAEEVARRIPTLVVTACEDRDIAEYVQRIFMNDFFRVYTSYDVVGVELGGALKNIYAIAAGFVDGCGLGDNTKAALMTRAIAEMSRLGKRLGGQRGTFSGLSGVGDLIVTCTSRHSRNRYVGEELGKGRKIDEIIRSMNMVVAEGVKTCEAAYELSERWNVETPLIHGIYAVIHDGRDAREVVHGLMTRKAKNEEE
ncbi:MAG: glycerol-3-phosphate 1-O-acyltransferase PlsY [Lentisphaeria bacterium]|jgi:glycerol-3-phosphate dehydrogenase (NAD(P)+)|nr:glycerol-3-phosphate 1-O-acyltransferase PlsY [Lentisphaeria bacterium]